MNAQEIARKEESVFMTQQETNDVYVPTVLFQQKMERAEVKIISILFL